MEVFIVSPPTGLCQENWPLSYVSLVRATYCTIGSGQFTLLSGRPVQTGQVLFEFKFTTALGINYIDLYIGIVWCMCILIVLDLLACINGSMHFLTCFSMPNNVFYPKIQLNPTWVIHQKNLSKVVLTIFQWVLYYFT